MKKVVLKYEINLSQQELELLMTRANTGQKKLIPTFILLINTFLRFITQIFKH